MRLTFDSAWRQYSRAITLLASHAGIDAPQAVRVSVSQRWILPHCMGGIVRIPASMFSMAQGPDDSDRLSFAHTVIHELRHAADYQDRACDALTRDEMEARARKAERSISDDMALSILANYLP